MIKREVKRSNKKGLRAAKEHAAGAALAVPFARVGEDLLLLRLGLVQGLGVAAPLEHLAVHLLRLDDAELLRDAVL